MRHSHILYIDIPLCLRNVMRQTVTVWSSMKWKEVVLQGRHSTVWTYR